MAPALIERDAITSVPADTAPLKEADAALKAPVTVAVLPTLRAPAMFPVVPTVRDVPTETEPPFEISATTPSPRVAVQAPVDGEILQARIARRYRQPGAEASAGGR